MTIEVEDVTESSPLNVDEAWDLLRLAGSVIGVPEAVAHALSAEALAKQKSCPATVTAFLVGAGFALVNVSCEVKSVIEATGGSAREPPPWAAMLLEFMGMLPVLRAEVAEKSGAAS